MRMRVLSILFASLVGISLFVAASNSRAADEPGSASATLGSVSEDIISARMKFLAKNSPYLVKISMGDEGLGTGFVYKHENGIFFILTNNHVVEASSASTAEVLFEGEKDRRVTEIIGRDPALDVALLAMPQSSPRTVSPAPVNFSASLEIGDELYAIGYPYGERQVTFGWVNGLKATENPWSFSSQVPIHPGNSGGPMIRFGKNEQPEVVGINTAIRGIGLKSASIHLRYVKRMFSRLLREKIIAHAAMGAWFDDSEQISVSFFESQLRTTYPPPEHGVMVRGVLPGSPAEEAGLKEGDLLVKVVVKEHEISIKSKQEFRELLFFDMRPGDTLTLYVKRGAQVLEKTIVLGNHESIPQEERKGLQRFF